MKMSEIGMKMSEIMQRIGDSPTVSITLLNAKDFASRGFGV